MNILTYYIIQYFLGALLSITLFHSYLTHLMVIYSLVFVSGIMFGVSCIELVPEGIRYQQHQYFISGIISGIMIMCGAIFLAEL